MKKAILFTAGVALSTLGLAQKQNIQSASNSLRNKEYDKAIEYINLAANDASSKDNPKTWYVKGNIYMDMQQDAKYKPQSPYREAATSYMKTATLDAKYEKENVDAMLISCAYSYYNDAVVAYNAKKYDDAITYSKTTSDIHDMEAGKRFANKSFDTVSAQSMIIQGYSLYYAKKYADALPVFNNLKINPVTKSANIYLALIDIFKNLNKEQDMLAMFDEARKQYPDNQNIRNEELNYYIKLGKQDVLIKKLEDAVTTDPNNAELLFNLANGYSNMAFPKDVNGKDMPKPANFLEYAGKAEASYAKALKIDAENGGYNYNMGVLFYNQASEFNNKINDIKGNTAADLKKYDELKAQRDAMFDKAIPFLEKTYTVLGSKLGSLNADDKFSYQSALIALKEIYARKDDMNKSNEYKKKLDESRAKK
jgi:hypothetical protein